MIGRRIRNSVRSFHLGLLGWHVGQDFPQRRHGGGPAPRAGKLYLPPGEDISEAVRPTGSPIRHVSKAANSTGSIVVSLPTWGLTQLSCGAL